MPTQNSKNLYANNFILQLNGTNAPKEIIDNVLEIVVDESLHEPSKFTIKIHNVYGSASENSEPWKNEEYYNIGDQILIGFEASNTQDPKFREGEIEKQLIDGEITGIEVNFSRESKAHVVLRCHDVSHRLHRGRSNQSFLNSTDTDIVRLVAQQAGIKIGRLDKSDVVHEHVYQENQTNIDFLQERAAKIGFELFVQDNKIHFRKPEGEDSLELVWTEDLTSFHVKVNSAEQVSSVQVNSWDYPRKELISETATKEQLVTETGNSNGSSIAQQFKMKQSPEMIVVDQPVDSAEEAKKMAQALCNEIGGKFVTADAKAAGNPEIRPGKVVKLKNMGNRYSGKYYITGTRHHYFSRNYTTGFKVRGLKDDSLLSTLSPKTHLQPGQTLLVGIVTNNKDPQNLGRVKVKFPTLTMDHDSHWARVVGLGAGDGRGFYCLPEIHDEVLVGFEHGDIHRPYIMGGVWNGVDKTVETVADTVLNGQVRRRTFKTRTGHMIQFIEEDNSDSKAGIYIETKNGQSVHLKDGEGCIDIDTTGQINISAKGEMSLLGSSGIPQMPSAINIDGGILPVNISSMAGGINISSTAGPISIDSTLGGVEISSTAGPISIDSPAAPIIIDSTLGINLLSEAPITIGASVINMAAATTINMAAPIINMGGGVINMQAPPLFPSPAATAGAGAATAAVTAASAGAGAIATAKATKKTAAIAAKQKVTAAKEKVTAAKEKAKNISNKK